MVLESRLRLIFDLLRNENSQINFGPGCDLQTEGIPLLEITTYYRRKIAHITDHYLNAISTKSIYIFMNLSIHAHNVKGIISNWSNQLSTMSSTTQQLEKNWLTFSFQLVLLFNS